MNASQAMGAAVAGGRLLHKNGMTYRIIGPVDVQVSGEWRPAISYRRGNRTFIRVLDDCENLTHLPGEPHKRIIRGLAVVAAGLALALAFAQKARAEIFASMQNQPYCASWNSAQTFTKVFRSDREAGYEVFHAQRDCGFLKAGLRYAVLEDSGMESWADTPVRRVMFLGGPTSGYEVWLVLGEDKPEPSSRKPR